MKKTHIQNTLGQNVCSKDFKKNKQNNIVMSNDFKYIDKKVYCITCAEAVGKPYFDDDDIFYMKQKKKIHVKKSIEKIITMK